MDMAVKIHDADDPRFAPLPRFNRDQALERMGQRLQWLHAQPFGRGVIFINLDDELGRAIGADGLVLWCARHGLSLHAHANRGRMFTITRERFH